MVGREEVAPAGSPIDGSAPGGGLGYAVDLSADGNVLALAERNTGLCHVYEWDPASESRFLRGAVDANAASGEEEHVDGAASGAAVIDAVVLSSDGTVLALGLGSLDEARVFEWDGASYVQRHASLVGSNSGEDFGRAIALSEDGSIIIVGARMHDSERGVVRVFSLAGSLEVREMCTRFVKSALSSRPRHNFSNCQSLTSCTF